MHTPAFVAAPAPSGPADDTTEGWDHRPGAPRDPIETGSPPGLSALAIEADEADEAVGTTAFSAIRSIAAGVISLALHGALLGWLVHGPSLSGIGAGGHDLEAVSIEMISASALESLSARAGAAAAGAAGAIAETVGVEAPSQAESVAVAAGEPEAKPEVSPPPPPPDIVAKPDPAPETADALNVAETQPPPTDAPVERKPEDQPRDLLHEAPPEPVEMPPESPRPPTATTASEAQVALITGGATSHAAAAEKTESEAAAGASPGELARYALAVRLALGRARPSHVGRKGKVLVSFRLSLGGTVEVAGIHRSSGIRALDRAALAAVNAATFPQPPAGSTAAQRSYTVPFDFR